MPDIVQVTVKTKTLDLFRFMLFHGYSKISGIVTLIFSVVSLFMLPVSIFIWHDNFVTAAFALLVIIYLIMTPLNMLSQAKRQVMSNPVFKNPITYHISEEIFEVQQYTGKVRLYWKQIQKVVKTPYDYLFYVNKDQAFVMPLVNVDPEELPTLEKILAAVKSDIGSTILSEEPAKTSYSKSKTVKNQKVTGLEKQLMELASKDGPALDNEDKELSHIVEAELEEKTTDNNNAKKESKKNRSRNKKKSGK